MKVIGYIRVSTDQQDLKKQKHLLLQYAQQHQLLISEFIESEASSRKDQKTRKIDELQNKLNKGDTLLVAELSRVGRNMLETLNIINTLSNKEVKIIFIRQPELSTIGQHNKLLLAIYGYFAEAEREYISIRTKQGLAAAKASGKQLGRPKGSKNKNGSILTPFNEQIKKYLELGLTISAIQKIINNQLAKPLRYNSFRHHIQANKNNINYIN
ncbi:MAG: recombinase family protein [Gammaproteobacteria bacterium]|jgi:DNA invertase Pin-like site-specific DNA recombinase